jgi:hypothetical protein
MHRKLSASIDPMLGFREPRMKQKMNSPANKQGRGEPTLVEYAFRMGGADRVYARPKMI